MNLITPGVYLACVLTGIALTVLAWRRPQRIARPGALLDALMASPAARIALVAFWWWLGWHFLVEQNG